LFCGCTWPGCCHVVWSRLAAAEHFIFNVFNYCQTLRRSLLRFSGVPIRDWIFI
jgi:hypothetical protein